MFAQHGIYREIVDSDGDYGIVIKDPQKALKETTAGDF